MAKQKFETIQTLRGIAATLVATLHLHLAVESEGFRWDLGQALLSKGALGVDIFFVISGFVICYVAFCGRRPVATKFLTDRFMRIYPRYWATLVFAISFSVGLAVIYGDPSKLPSMWQVMNSVLLLPYWPNAYVITVAWTLGLEVVFYIIFAIVALRFGINALIVALMTWYGLSIAGLFKSGDFSGWAYPLFNPIILELLFGVLVARVCLAGFTWCQRTAFVISLVLFAAIIALEISTTPTLRREFLFGVPSVLLVYGAAGLHIKWSKVAILWGESSYMLYLLHIPLFMLTARGIEELTGFNVYSAPAAACGMLLVVTLICMALTKWCERPYQRYYKNKLRQRRHPEETAPA